MKPSKWIEKELEKIILNRNRSYDDRDRIELIIKYLDKKYEKEKNNKSKKEKIMEDKDLFKGTIGWAVRMLREGTTVQRAGWNGKGQFLGLWGPDKHSTNTLPYVYIVTVQKKRVPWICSQTDLLAEDWVVYR